MAIDAWMLDQLQRGGRPCLRLYRWSRPTLSLGVHQQRLEPHWPALVQAGRMALVRRPTGGRAVLHGGDLTYALVHLPTSRHRLEAYRQACRWLQEAFDAWGQPLLLGRDTAAAAQQRSSCFASATAADLVHSNGSKRIGSAQLWRGPALLQHGSLLLQPRQHLWQQVFQQAPPALPPLDLPASALEQQLRRSAERALCGGPLQLEPLSASEWQEIQARRVDYLPSLASIERATAPRAMPSG